MNRSSHFLLFASLCLCFPNVPSLAAQHSNEDASASIPHLIRFNGVLKDGEGKPAQGTVGVTFAFYKDQQGGAPLWMETQDVTADATGRYSVMLGATKSDGLPEQLFISKEARWLSVEPQSLPAPARVLLLSVPYALKAADSETVGGLPPSAFVLAGAASAGQGPASSAAISLAATPSSNPAVTGAGKANTVPLWDSASDIVSSAISQTGTGTTAKIGINNAAPLVPLDVKGATTIRGLLTLPPTANATAAAGKTSQTLNLSGAAFNSAMAGSVNQTFRLQTEPTSNNTASPSGKLSLLYYAGANPATETGLSIASNGQITFAPGQTFPGAGGGSITGVTAGTALTGGGTTGNVTLNLDTTKVPQLGAANIFTNNQTISGNLNTSGTVTTSTLNATSAYDLQGLPFAYGSSSTNLFVGFGTGNTSATGTLNVGVGSGVLSVLSSGIGNVATGWDVLSANTTGSSNTGTGRLALQLNTTGGSNTATGERALQNTTIGGENTAIGLAALLNNTTGNDNTALGVFAGPYSGNSNLSNTTAIGAHATVGANNSLVLGSIAGLNGATADTFVGIGTPTPTAKLDVHGTANFTGLITFAAGQTFPGAGTITGVTAGTGLTGGGTSGNVPLSLDTTKVPQLSTANTFTGNQTVNANLSATGVVSAASYQIGSNLFAAGNATTNNVYLGFAGNQTTTGYGNTGTGGQALVANAAGVNNTATGQASLPRNTSGTDNVAMGVVALEYNTQGNYNTASGVAALAFNTTGSNNTAVGYLAGPDANHPNLVNATAIGANAVVSESNALVLGPAGVSVGIGTATPAYPLHVNGVMRSELGLSLGGNAPVVVDAPGIVAGRFTILANGNVGINKPNPTTTLDVAGNIDASGALIGGSLNVGGSGIINGGLTTSAGITTGAGVSVGGPLSTSGGLTINGDTSLNAAPHMYFGGFFPGNVAPGQVGGYVVPSKDILITRVTLGGGFLGFNISGGCSPTGTIGVINISGGPLNLVPVYLLDIAQNSDPSYRSDSGPISVPVAGGTPLVFDVWAGAACGLNPGPNNLYLSVEYVMQ
jgi:hypothetical protein